MQACHADAVGNDIETISHALVELHRARLHRYALRLCHQMSDADDLVQDTFARALKDRDAIPKCVGPWLITILHRLFIDQCRRRKAESKLHEGIRHITPIYKEAEPRPLPRWLTVSDDEVRAAVNNLPALLQVPYLMRMEGKSYKTISDELEVSINTVSTRIRRARLALRAALSTDNPDDEEHSS